MQSEKCKMQNANPEMKITVVNKINPACIKGI
jgi:hypothetical protein